MFLVYTQSFLPTNNDLGLGSAVPIRLLSDLPIRSLFDSLALNEKPFYWIDSTKASSSFPLLCGDAHLDFFAAASRHTAEPSEPDRECAGTGLRLPADVRRP